MSKLTRVLPVLAVLLGLAVLAPMGAVANEPTTPVGPESPPIPTPTVTPPPIPIPTPTVTPPPPPVEFAQDEASYSLVENSATSLALPSATGGTGPITYSLSDASLLAVGLRYRASDNTITGQAREAADETGFTLTATDSVGDTDTMVIKLTVLEDTRPEFAHDEVSITLSVGHVEDRALPTATGGNGTITYSLLSRPALPSWATLDATVPSLSGIPTAAMAETTYVLVATDEDGDHDIMDVKITVVSTAAPSFSQPVSDFFFVQGKAVSQPLPLAHGGNWPITYWLSGTPAGLALDSGTHTLSGTPTATQARTDYVLTATDADGQFDAMTIRVLISADYQPAFSPESVSYEFRVGEQRQQFFLFAVGPGTHMGNGPSTGAFSDASKLPSGLEYRDDAPFYRLTGTPTEAMEPTDFTFTITDFDGDTAEATITITVEEDTRPSFADDEVSYTWVTGSAVDQVLPSAIGGNGLLSYALAPPPLPEGLSYAASSNSITGTPTAATSGEVWNMLWVSDEDGDTAGLRINMRVDLDSSPSFADEDDEVSHTLTQFKHGWVSLPSALGGNEPLSYAISNVADLPDSIEYDPNYNTISGTPTAAKDETAYTLTVTDVDGDTDTITVKLTVDPRTLEFPAGSSATYTLSAGRSVDRALPTATGGSGQITYSLATSPALPTGVTYDPITNSLRGTAPQSPSPEVTVVLTVTDATGATDTVNIGVVVVADTFPAFSTSEVSYSLTQHTNVFQPLPSTISGNDLITYTLHDIVDLPYVDGEAWNLSYNAPLNLLVGTPRAALAETSFTLTATDIDGDTAQMTIKITVAADTSLKFDPGNYGYEFRVGTPVNVWLPKAYGGVGTVSYRFGNEPLVAGLSFDSQNRKITGTPTTPGEVSIRWSVADTSGQADSVSLEIKVLEAIVPGPVAGDSTPAFSSAETVVALTVGSHVNWALPHVSGGNWPLSYSLADSPALPSGLSYDAATNMLVGTAPDSAVAETSIVLTATDADGDTDTLDVKMSVVDP